MEEFPANVYYRIAEKTREIFTNSTIGPEDIHEIIHAKTLGWPNGVVAFVLQSANSYDHIRKQKEKQ